MMARGHKTLRVMVASTAFGGLLMAGLAGVVESAPAAPADAESGAAATGPSIIPAPVSMTTSPTGFRIGPDTAIVVRGPERAVAVGEFLADVLRPSTGYALPVQTRPAANAITLRVTTDGELTGEAYQLDVAPGVVALRAGTPEGLFRGVQTVRQLLPAKVEHDSVQPGPWQLPGTHITDAP